MLEYLDYLLFGVWPGDGKQLLCLEYFQLLLWFELNIPVSLLQILEFLSMNSWLQSNLDGQEL